MGFLTEKYLRRVKDERLNELYDMVVDWGLMIEAEMVSRGARRGDELPEHKEAEE